MELASYIKKKLIRTYSTYYMYVFFFIIQLPSP